MTPSLGLACLWLVLANVFAILPSRRKHWPQAWFLIATGVPLLAWVFLQNGAIIGTLVLVAGASVLRWPLRFLLRWIRRKRGRQG